MKNFLAWGVAVGLLGIVMPVGAQQQEPGLAVVTELAQLNGQALACQEATVSARAKKLMLAHVPKVQRYGTAFEDGTNQAYLEQARGAQPCTDLAGFYRRLETLAARLQSTFPESATEGR